MVMIDQQQLIELMEAKKMLEMQKNNKVEALWSSQTATNDLIGKAFNSGTGLFLTPPKESTV